MVIDVFKFMDNFLVGNGGHTTTPLLSAECQNIDCEGF